MVVVAHWNVDSVLSCCVGSTSADDKCYSKFNVGGHFNGHCGINTTTGLFNKCSAK